MHPRCQLPRRSWRLEHNQCHSLFHFYFKSFRATPEDSLPEPDLGHNSATAFEARRRSRHAFPQLCRISTPSKTHRIEPTCPTSYTSTSTLTTPCSTAPVTSKSSAVASKNRACPRSP